MMTMPEATFHAMADQLKRAGQERPHHSESGDKRPSPYRLDPLEEGRRIAQESAAAFREAIKIRSDT